MMSKIPKVFIVGGGFAGIAAAKALAGAMTVSILITALNERGIPET